MRRGLEHAVAKPAPADVRSLHLLAAIRLVNEAGMTALVPAIRSWAHELAGCRIDGILMNSTYETGTPHLWAHIQEGVLVEAAGLLGETGLGEIAAESAERLLLPAVQSAFDRESCSAYDVASCIYGLDRLAAGTGEERWARGAADARAWFDGRNPSGRPVYDTEHGRVADGVDEGRVSENSGAEANIEGAGALLDRVVQGVASRGDPFAGLTE
jgi:hypothetical protein